MAKAKKSASHKSKKKRGSALPFGFLFTALFAAWSSGVVDVRWADGTPSVSVDDERLAQLTGGIFDFGDDATGGASSPSPGAPAPTPSPWPQTPLAQGPPPPAPFPQAPPPPIPVPQTPPPLAIPAAASPELLAPLAPLPPLAPPGPPIPAAPAVAPQSIKIASFNIQVFGTSKLQKSNVMPVLTNIVRQFDVVAIQEVRSTDDTVIPTFIRMINAEGAQYDFVIGPRLGRTNSKEQYAIVFNTARLEVNRSSVYTVPDPQDLLHREPMVAQFRVRGVPANQAFTFSLVDIHTDPDETKSELDALADVFVGVQHNGSGEDDVILLGDLNVDENHLGKLGRLPGIEHAITGVTTNTRHNKMYDNIVFNRQATTEYTGRFGVLDLMSTFGLSEAQALEVSDHCPVWAEFSVYESANARPVATAPTSLPR